jgi:hypothetical protein
MIENLNLPMKKSDSVGDTPNDLPISKSLWRSSFIGEIHHRPQVNLNVNKKIFFLG